MGCLLYSRLYGCQSFTVAKPPPRCRRAAVVPPELSMILSSARSASGTPAPECRQQQRRFLARPLEPGHLLLDLLRRHRVDLGERHDFGLVGQAVIIGYELGPHGLVGLAGVLAGAVDQVQQHPAAFDVAEEAVA
jgi:hypothetical protein